MDVFLRVRACVRVMERAYIMCTVKDPHDVWWMCICTCACVRVSVCMYDYHIAVSIKTLAPFLNDDERLSIPCKPASAS